jgi:hypothetical protein
MTVWALLAVTTGDVELTFEYSAVSAGVFVGSPVILLGAKGDSRDRLTGQGEVGLELGLLDAFGPAFDHPDSAVFHESLGHSESDGLAAA